MYQTATFLQLNFCKKMFCWSKKRLKYCIEYYVMNILVDNFEQYRAYVWSIKKINRFLDVRKLNTRLQPDLIYQTRRLHLPRTHFSSYWPWCCVLTQALYSHRYLHFILSILVLVIANSRKEQNLRRIYISPIYQVSH